MKNFTHTKIVCLGGGIGTVTLLKGIQKYTDNVSAVLSMADDGGSGGRLRRLYNVLPIGDLVSAMTALSEFDESVHKLLLYRFPGDRYGKDNEIAGHKLGNLLLVALFNITGDIEKAIEEFKKIFHVHGSFFPATLDSVSISAKTTYGKEIQGEEAIDLGSFKGEKSYDTVTLHPKNAKLNPKAKKALEEADVIVAGPGDLYSTVLPTLIIPEVLELLKKTKAKRMFVVNITNQPEETKGYNTNSFLDALQRNLGTIPFDIVLTNNNFSAAIPKNTKNTYVTIVPSHFAAIKLVSADVVDTKNPLLHDSLKLANTIFKLI